MAIPVSTANRWLREYDIDTGEKNPPATSKPRRKIEFMLRTGCRVKELSQLKFCHCDDAFINFVGAKGKPRQFPILRNKEIKQVLNKIDKLQNKNREYVLSDRGGYWLGRSDWLSKMVKKNMRKAGLPDSFCAHLLRATFATQLIYKDMPMPIVSKLLGHQSVITTEKHYAHIKPEYIQINTNYIGTSNQFNT